MSGRNERLRRVTCVGEAQTVKVGDWLKTPLGWAVVFTISKRGKHPLTGSELLDIRHAAFTDERLVTGCYDTTALVEFARPLELLYDIKD